jgi:tRNA (guanine-N7-)-methyltransferase
MRLRRKPWIDEAIQDYVSFLYLEPPVENKGHWEDVFPKKQPLHVEFGTGKGQFISRMADQHRDINYIGMERQEGVIYYAAKKTADIEPELDNVRLILGDVSNIDALFAPHEVDVIYLNFSDPWPKKRHAKRRLTHRSFLQKYAAILKKDGEIRFKTDNKDLFDFSIEEFREMKWKLTDVTYDLHADPVPGDAMTEYEEKFSKRGNRICRLVAHIPDSQ